jgi:hypothetical protein
MTRGVGIAKRGDMVEHCLEQVIQPAETLWMICQKDMRVWNR